MRLVLWGDRVFVRPILPQVADPGGLVVVPESVAAPLPTTGVVVAVGDAGPGSAIDVTGIQVGMTVFFPETAGTVVQVDNEELLLLPVSEISGVIEEDVHGER